MNDPQGFSFTKWYLDCVAADGRALIAYWAELSWHSLALTWQHASLFEHDGTRSHHGSSLTRTAEPQLRDRTVTWPPTLGEIHVEARIPPIDDVRLHQGSDGYVDWRAEAPASMVSANLHGRASIAGPGYVERIRMTIPPWQLPIRELRWGRWLDADASRSVMWIDWRGRAPQTRAFIDGTCATDTIVSDSCVSAGATRIAFGDRVRLRSHSLGEIVGTIPPLRALVPGSLLAMSQTRWCTTATRTDSGSAAIAGRAIHEVVVF